MRFDIGKMAGLKVAAFVVKQLIFTIGYFDAGLLGKKGKGIPIGIYKY